MKEQLFLMPHGVPFALHFTTETSINKRVEYCVQPNIKPIEYAMETI